MNKVQIAGSQKRPPIRFSGLLSFSPSRTPLPFVLQTPYSLVIPFPYSFVIPYPYSLVIPYALSFRHPGTGAAGIRDLPYTVRQFLHQTEIKKIPDIFFENSGMTKMLKILG